MKSLLYIFVLIVFIVSLSCNSASNGNPRISIRTEAGDIEVELYPGKAPKTVAAFLSYIDSGFYKNSNFYRVLNDDNQPSNAPKAELIQGGIWKVNYKKATSLPGIPHETTQQTGLLHKDGTLSLARQEPGTATTEFFICVGDQPGFDFGGDNNPDKQGYAAFGKVIKGMEVVRAIYKKEENNQAFDPPVLIVNIKRM